MCIKVHIPKIKFSSSSSLCEPGVLDLTGLVVEKSMEKAFAQALASCNDITEVVIKDSSGSDLPLATILNSLKDNLNITSLILDGTDLTSSFVMFALTSILSSNSSLQK